MRTGVNVAYGLNLRTLLVATETAIRETRETVLSNNPLLTIPALAERIADLIVNDPSHAVLCRPS